MPSLLVGRYRLLEQLGAGGMGVVWRAVDELLHREVAVKEVKAPDHLPEDGVRRLYERLRKEARAAAQITHPQVTTVHDIVECLDRPWIVMELIRGRSLQDTLQEHGAVHPAHAADVGLAVLGALRCAHDVGVLHRDVKPGNILVEESGGRVVLTDFGIAQIHGSAQLTQAYEIVGSPEYLPPERVCGRPAEPASDLWSLGVTLYVMVEGRSPFRRTTALSTLQAVATEAVPPPVRAGALAPVLAALLRKDPAARPGHAELERLLRAVAHPATVISRTRPGATAQPTTRSAMPQTPRTPRTSRTSVPPAPAPPPPGPPPPGPLPSGALPSAGPRGAYGPPPPRSSTSGTSGTSSTPSALRTPSTGPRHGEPPPRRRRLTMLAVALAVVLAIGAGTAAAVLNQQTGNGNRPGADQSSPAANPSDTGDEPKGPGASGDSTGAGETPDYTGGDCEGGWLPCED
ncbi:serine/threonine-protein kinase [Streptomyces apocyni]|uniref:serine/threonine-protein kinase n=1 Tax=Streptomyces apocyni TaxID=2654677 RepID=UPI001E4D81C6|nr:serine/threonine-protein kinase [Streptomyces apocyni]